MEKRKKGQMVKYYNHYVNLCTNVKGQKENKDTEITNVLLNHIPCICNVALDLFQQEETCICKHEVIYEQCKINDSFNAVHNTLRVRFILVLVSWVQLDLVY